MLPHFVQELITGALNAGLTALLLALLCDGLLICLVVYLAIRSIPFGRRSLLFDLVFTGSFFLTLGLLAITLIKCFMHLFKQWIPADSFAYIQAGYVLIFIVPTLLYIYILYVSYVKVNVLKDRSLFD